MNMATSLSTPSLLCLFLCRVCPLAHKRALSSAKHSGIRSLFHQNFVKSGLVDPELGQLYDRLFDNRQKGDYTDLVRFDPNEVRDWHDEAFEFVETVKNIVKKELDGQR